MASSWSEYLRVVVYFGDSLKLIDDDYVKKFLPEGKRELVAWLFCGYSLNSQLANFVCSEESHLDPAEYIKEKIRGKFQVYHEMLETCPEVYIQELGALDIMLRELATKFWDMFNGLFEDASVMVEKERCQWAGDFLILRVRVRK